MNRTNEEELLKRYRDGQCSKAELDQLHAWYADWNIEDRTILSEADLDHAEKLMRSNVMERTNINVSPALQDGTKNNRLWPRITILAAAVATIVFGIWLFADNPKTDDVAYANDIAPGKNTATLTLPTGEKIELSDAKSGVVIDASRLAYSDGEALAISSEAQQPNAPKTMEVQTPRGGTYQVILPDGTKAWLNAASSIKFPSSFSDEKRTVSVSGEIYFEVAKDHAHPFIVSSTGQEVEVLGTHFNINTYGDDGSMKTTLLEGSVRVSPLIASHDVTLKPGQQSVLRENKIQTKTVDIKETTAWKDGNFRFVDQPVDDIMKQIARWYNVEVVYEDEVSDIRLNAAISRNRNVSQVLKMMEKTDEVHFKIEGRRIIVRR